MRAEPSLSRSDNLPTTPLGASPDSRYEWLEYGVPHRVNLDQEALRRLAQTATPAMLSTGFDNLNKVSRNKARMAKHTYVITDGDPEVWSHKTMGVAAANALIEAQAAYITGQGELLEVQGWIGVGPRAVAVQWLYTIEGANIAGMQSVLAFPRDRVEDDVNAPFRARFRVVYTPNFHPDVDGGQRILVDLENYVTYIMGPDYFGESKKAALRMLCNLVHSEGGLVLHAGAKEVILPTERLTVAILGLSGTGKTTTTFSKQGDGVRPVQDDMVALWPAGELSVTENGCFAKTFGLSIETEPVLYESSIHPSAWLENVYQDADGTVNFTKGTLSPIEVGNLRDVLIETGADPKRLESYVTGKVALEDLLDDNGLPIDGYDFVAWTENGRSIIPLSSIDNAADLSNIPPVRSMGVLNRDEGEGAITPGLVRFTSPEQAAGYFMLGETTKTSAAGKDRGKTRSPFTQPFFPGHHGQQARRFAELLSSTDAISCWLMNTGYVGGVAGSEHALKVKIRHSSALLEALFTNRIVWTRDNDFGYEVVDLAAPENEALFDAVGIAILRPDVYYANTGRDAIYREEVARRHADRAHFLRSFEVDEAIVSAVVP